MKQSHFTQVDVARIAEQQIAKKYRCVRLKDKILVCVQTKTKSGLWLFFKPKMHVPSTHDMEKVKIQTRFNLAVSFVTCPLTAELQIKRYLDGN